MIVIKRDAQGREVLRYPAEVLERGTTWIKVQASFSVDYANVGLFAFRKGDAMTEWFYSDRYYNIFKVVDPDSGVLKGWYCNITRPAEITETAIAADDLALDVIVSATGEIIVDDEDDFATLALAPQERQRARDAVTTLRQLIAKREPPFVF